MEALSRAVHGPIYGPIYGPMAYDESHWANGRPGKVVFVSTL